MRRRVVVLLAGFAALAGCTSHIAPYRSKERHFRARDYETPPGPNAGSLYAHGTPGMFEDAVAIRVGDIVIIRIDEREQASRDASTSLDRAHSSSYGAAKVFGLMAALQAAHPSIDPTKLFGADSSSQFSGAGSIERSGTLNATLPVRVRRIMPNGDLFVEGTKVVMVGAEEHHIYVSGIVRSFDIAFDGSIASSRVADAEIEYTGRGDVDDQQRPGWFSRLLSKMWPF